MNPNNQIQYIEQKLKYIITEGNIDLGHSNGIYDQIFRSFVGTLPYYTNSEGRRAKLTQKDEVSIITYLAQNIEGLVSLTDTYLSQIGIAVENTVNKYECAANVVSEQLQYLTHEQAESGKLAQELMAKNDTLHPKIA